MGFLDRLTQILNALPKKITLQPSFSLINITNNTKNTTNNSDSSNTVNINLNDLTPDKKDEVLKLFPLALEEDYVFIESDSKKLIEDLRQKENLPENRKLLDFLKDKISLQDYSIWRASLYLRDRFEAQDKESTNNLKSQIMEKYGDKGKNIANLCTARYLEDFLMPLYASLEQVHGSDEKAKEIFSKIYDKIIGELPFTIFVSSQMSVDNIREQIRIKKGYGIKFLNIHGIGEYNLKKIREIIEIMQKDASIPFGKSVREEQNIMFVRITFLDPDKSKAS